MAIPDPLISEAEALQIARAECERRGLPWMEPVHVHPWLREYRVWTNDGSIGGNASVHVDIHTGEVTHLWGGLPR